MHRHTTTELAALPTLATGHTDNLKIDGPLRRVWLSRMTTEDGMPYDNQVTVETLISGRWLETETYPGGIDKSAPG